MELSHLCSTLWYSFDISIKLSWSVKSLLSIISSSGCNFHHSIFAFSLIKCHVLVDSSRGFFNWEFNFKNSQNCSQSSDGIGAHLCVENLFNKYLILFSFGISIIWSKVIVSFTAGISTSIILVFLIIQLISSSL